MGKKDWISGAVKSIKKRGTEGVCTGSKFGGPSCRPGTRRYALAKTFKKMARKRKHAEGGIVDNEGFYNEFADGGILDLFGGTLSGVTSGASMGPVGMIGGGLMGLVSGIANMNAKQEQEELLKKQQLLQNRAINNQNFLQSLPQSNVYTPTFPDGGTVVNPTVRKYKDTSAIQPYKDPFTSKDFYVVKGTESNINRPDVFPIDTYDGGARIMYGTYTAPRTKGSIPESDYDRTTFRKFLDDNTTRPFYPSTNIGRLYEGNNPYKGRTTLANYGLLTDPNINPMYGKGTGGQTNTKDYTAYSFANGGVTTANSELEKGEPFRTPDGQIYQVSNNAPTHQQGGVPMNLPNGTQILGKMTDPETDEQFKEIGQKLKRAQDRYNKVLDSNPTPLAKKTAKMMLDKIQGRYDNLMQKQEMMKSPQSTNMYPNGGITGVRGTTDWTIQDPRFTAPTQQQFMINTATDPVTSNDVIQQPTTNPDNTWNSVQDIVGTIGEYAPIMYNLAEGIGGRPDTLRTTDYYNPYSSQVKTLMSGRRYNVSPELEANRQAMRGYFQALQQGAPTQSRYLAGLQSGQISRQRADAEAYARKQNIDNQYRVEEAQTLQGLGAQEAATNMQVEDINARRIAAQRQYLPTALSQLQQAAFVGQQGRMMKQRDKERLAIAKELYKNYPFDLTKIFNQ